MINPAQQFARYGETYSAQLITPEAATLAPYQVHTLQFVGRDPMRCTVDQQTRRLTCDGAPSGCVATPTGVVCPPGTSLSDVSFPIPSLLIGLLIGLGLWWAVKSR